MAVNVYMFIFKLLAQARKPGQEVLILIYQHMLLQGNTVRQWEQGRRDGPFNDDIFLVFLYFLL
jgi:hypothetical protein